MSFKLIQAIGILKWLASRPVTSLRVPGRATPICLWTVQRPTRMLSTFLPEERSIKRFQAQRPLAALRSPGNLWVMALTAGISQIGGHDNTSGAGWSINGIEIALRRDWPTCAGFAGGVLSDGLVAGGNNQILQLLGLTPNTDYVFTWFSPLWTGNTDRVGILDGSDDGLGQGMTIAVVQDADAELLITQYRYNTGNSTTFRMHFDQLDTGRNTSSLRVYQRVGHRTW